MAELKTKENSASVSEFIALVDDDQKQKDSKELLKIFKEVTGFKPKMWGASIIGFGSYHYVYDSGREGDWLLTGFSPRKANISLYLTCGLEGADDILAKLGPHKKSVGCVYIKRLSDIHIPTLKKLIKYALKKLRKKYPE